MKATILIREQQSFANYVNKIKLAGAQSFFVVTDFDHTLTIGYRDGVLEQLNRALKPDLLAKYAEINAHYTPLKTDPSLSTSQRHAAMEAWWALHFALLQTSGLSQQLITKLAKNNTLQFRPGIHTFVRFLNKHRIPLIIMSVSSGDMIIALLRQEGLLLPNVHVVTNFYDYDTSGNVIALRKPLTHFSNKHEIVMQDFPIFEQIKSRRNILLLGDAIGDVGMSECFQYETLIKVGFLNHDQEQKLQSFSDNFDVVLTADGSMRYVNKLLTTILTD